MIEIAKLGPYWNKASTESQQLYQTWHYLSKIYKTETYDKAHNIR